MSRETPPFPMRHAEETALGLGEKMPKFRLSVL